MSAQQQAIAVRPPGAGMRALRAVSVPAGSLAVLVLVLIAWEIASGLTFVIPSVPDTFSALGKNLGSSVYLGYARYTLVNIGISFAIGGALGAVLGVILGYVPPLRRAVEPLLVAVNSVPKIILYPLLLPIFHVGATSQIAMGVIHAVFPMLIMVTGAVAHMPPVYRKLGKSLEASHWQILWHITLPAVRRSFLTGLRLAVSLATIGVILAEFFATETGLGKSMRQAYTFLQYGSLIGTVLLLLVVCFCASFLIWLVERRMPE
jgi:NitT/TauT family transport system permease protein